MGSSLSPFRLAISLLVFLSFLAVQDGLAEPNQRSFRPIVPIKQDVLSNSRGSVEQKVTVKIPPPPIPQPDGSLFPEASVPEVTVSPDTDWLGPQDLGAGNAGETPSETGEDEIGSGETPQKTVGDDQDATPDGPTLSRLREEAHALADRGLKYKFGADDPDTGGLDCSGAMQYLLTKIGVEGVPRTSYDQYYWLKKKKLLDDVYGKGSTRKLFKKLSPGDLIFWGGTWKSGHRVSHVMLYMGYNPTEDKHYVFGARSKSSEGLLGNGVDIFELDPDRGRLIAHGKVPGLVYD